MEPDARQANPAARVRLIDLRVGSDRPSLHFGARLSAILTEPGSRRAAAHAIAATVAGPRPDDADGSVEVDGAVVSVRTLPSPLLPPGAPILVDREVLIAQWQAWCARRRDELAIAHASGRLDRHRIEVSLEQARARPAAAPEPAPDAASRNGPSPPGARRPRQTHASCGSVSPPCRVGRRRGAPLPERSSQRARGRPTWCSSRLRRRRRIAAA
jgi:hypothetical protein